MTTSTKPLRPLTADDLDARLAPDLTDLPLSEDEDGNWYGWGHIDPAVFVAGVNACGRHLGAWDTPDEDFEVRHVKHRWAVTTLTPEDNGGEWRCDWATEGDPGAWPITRVRG